MSEAETSHQLFSKLTHDVLCHPNVPRHLHESNQLSVDVMKRDFTKFISTWQTETAAATVSCLVAVFSCFSFGKPVEFIILVFVSIQQYIYIFKNEYFINILSHNQERAELLPLQLLYSNYWAAFLLCFIDLVKLMTLCYYFLLICLRDEGLVCFTKFGLNLCVSLDTVSGFSWENRAPSLSSHSTWSHVYINSHRWISSFSEHKINPARS